MDSETKRIIMVGVISLIVVLVVIISVLSISGGNSNISGAAVVEGAGVCSTLCPTCP